MIILHTTKQKTFKLMKQKRSKRVYTPNELIDCKRPLGWDEISKKLINAINRYNKQEEKKWEKSSFLHRLFWHPTKYEVGVEAVGDTETGNPVAINQYSGTHHHRIWIENTRSKRMHFDLLCSDGVMNSKFLQDGVKYKRFILITRDTSVSWLDKKCILMYKILPFINYEVS